MKQRRYFFLFLVSYLKVNNESDFYEKKNVNTLMQRVRIKTGLYLYFLK